MAVKNRVVTVGVRMGRGALITELDAPSEQFNSTVEWHAVGVGVGGGDYATLCGVDGNDPAVGQHGSVDASPGQKITCRQCRNIWDGVMTLKLRATDFER